MNSSMSTESSRKIWPYQKTATERGIVRDSLSQLQEITHNENELETKKIFETNIGKFRKVTMPWPMRWPKVNMGHKFLDLCLTK